MHPGIAFHPQQRWQRFLRARHPQFAQVEPSCQQQEQTSSSYSVESCSAEYKEWAPRQGFTKIFVKTPKWSEEWRKWKTDRPRLTDRKREEETAFPLALESKKNDWDDWYNSWQAKLQASRQLLTNCFYNCISLTCFWNWLLQVALQGPAK